MEVFNDYDFLARYVRKDNTLSAHQILAGKLVMDLKINSILDIGGDTVRRIGLVAVGVAGIGVVLRNVPLPETILSSMFQCILYLGCMGLWVFLVDRKIWGVLLISSRKNRHTI